jgi:Tol biopolymer transport system component
MVAMKSFILIILSALTCCIGTSFAQFGQNKVQYHDNEWFYIQTKHFDVYFNQDGAKIAEFASSAAEDALTAIQKRVNYSINNRISLILYNSQAEFQETNVTDDYLSEGIGGFTELFKNRVVLPFTGNYKMFRHVIHHELVHAVINDLFYGGSIQNVISNNINIRVPLWFNEGLAEYLSLGWDPNTDMFIRDAIHNDNLPDMNNLNGYLAYRGGQSIFYYISQKYGDEKIGELVNRVKSKTNFEDGLESTLGVKPEEFNERWKKFLKKRYWPDINIFQDPEEFAKKLTDPKKEGGSYNTSPAISPSGTQIAFISNRDFFFDVYIMNAQDGKIIKKLIKGNRTVDFEELNILTPGLTWSPDAAKIALAAKSAGSDVIYIIDVKSEDIETLPFRFPGIQTVHWSPDGSKLAFTAQTPSQSDLYTYDLKTQQLEKITDDIYSDYDPAWSPDGKVLFFTSDRGGSIARTDSGIAMYKHDYSQSDVYAIRLSDHKIVRITNTPIGDEYSPVCSPDGRQLLVISDKNGINNIYRINLGDKFTEKMAVDSSVTLIPVTNSLNGIYQLSTSADGKKLTFSSMYKSAYNIFVMTNPFEDKGTVKELPLTVFVTDLLTPKKEPAKGKLKDTVAVKDSVAAPENPFFTGQYIDSTKADGKGKQDYSNYVFGPSNYYQLNKAKDTTKFAPIDNLDQNGNYRVNKYKISFSPDIIYANAGFSTFYGLMGATVISFSDVLGNHRLVAQTSLQVDLKNSDYGLAYFYLPKRVDIGVEAFHTARFLYINYHQSGNAYLFRFRNYGVNLSFSYPFNRFYRLDWGLSNLNILTDNLDEPDSTMNNISYVLPMLSFVHDNTIFGYTSPIEGTRYRFDFVASPLQRDKANRFISTTFDYRTYLRFFTDYCFAFRVSGGMSRGGENRQRFFMGGIENWINRRFASENLPLNNASDFAFLTATLPMRGYDYAEQVGTTYGLVNMELRFPLIRYLVTGGLPLMFQNVLGTAFIDAGSAWDKTGELRFLKKDPQYGLQTNDLLLGTGFGARMYLLYFLARFDVAWAYNLQSFSRPVFYFSLGTDF